VTVDDSDGTVYDSDGTVDDSDGTVDDSDGTVYDSDGTVDDSDGTLADSGVQAPQECACEPLASGARRAPTPPPPPLLASTRSCLEATPVYCRRRRPACSGPGMERARRRRIRRLGAAST
jgi:hypothetical protein